MQSRIFVTPIITIFRRSGQLTVGQRRNEGSQLLNETKQIHWDTLMSCNRKGTFKACLFGFGPIKKHPFQKLTFDIRTKRNRIYVGCSKTIDFSVLRSRQH